MKYIDKFLKILKTDRNTFFTYVLTLISIYIAIDRVVELLFLCLTGISVSYWGPIAYTIAFACPVFAFLFSFSSKFVKDTTQKFAFTILYIIMLYIMAISMFVQWFNQAGWLLLLSVPNYAEIVTNFYPEVKRAFCAIAIYLPVTTFFSLFWFIYTELNDTPLEYQSIMDYTGLDISKKPEKLGPYAYEIAFGTDYETGAPAKIVDVRRYEPTFICGTSGTGKTSLVFEPMIAHDIKQKSFFKESSKALGYVALKTGLASLSCPYDNEYLNKNFNLNMLTINDGKEKLYKAYMHKMLLNENSLVYRDLGITFLSPDYEATSHMMDVADNFNIPYTLVDPSNSKSAGINPFAYGSPEEVAVVISTILSNTYFSLHPTPEEAYAQNLSSQAVENLSILLSEMYPRLHDGALANIEDILDMLNNFDLILDLCKKVEEIPELALKYKLQLNYFRKYFAPGDFIQQTESSIYSAINQLDSILRMSGLRNILCNRTNNINFEDALKNGELIFVCTRRGDLGPMLHKAFGLFFILSMQYAVLKRPGNENTRIPNFLYIDEFSDFICKNTLPLFTMYRKYRVGTIISTQNIDQLDAFEGSKQTILANCTTKMVFGNNSPKDNEFWSKELGYKKKWLMSVDYHLEPGNNHSSDLKGAKWDWTPYFKPEAIQNFKFKIAGFKSKDEKGKTYAAKVTLNFLDSEYKEPHSSKTYDFSKYNSSTVADQNTHSKNDYGLSYDNGSDPIQADPNLLFHNDDAIIFDINKHNNNN